MVLRFGVDRHVIQILAKQLASQQESHLNRVVRIVVAERTAASDGVYARVLLQVSLNDRNLFLIFKIINRVGTFGTNYKHILDVTFFDEAKLFNQILDTALHNRFVRHLPNMVTRGTKHSSTREVWSSSATIAALQFFGSCILPKIMSVSWM